MAAASVFVMHLDKKSYDSETHPIQSHLNVGFGADITIADLANAIGNTVGYEGKISFDPSKPDGSPRKWMDSSCLNKLGWRAEVEFDRGLQLTYRSFLENHS
jgi:GDP-L-fucose synthase